MSRVGILCALPSEARHLGRVSRRQGPVSTLADDTLLVISGMGCAAAELGARALLGAGATALASWGMAGGLDPALSAGSIVLPHTVVGIDGSAVITAREWRARLEAALCAVRGLAGGILLTSARAIGTVADKAALYRATGAAAVDMESLAVARVASEQGLPFIALRVIVDAAADELPPALSAAADKAGPLQLWRLIGALALAPAQLAPLIRLAWRYRAANRALAAVARAGALRSQALAAS